MVTSVSFDFSVTTSGASSLNRLKRKTTLWPLFMDGVELPQG